MFRRIALMLSVLVVLIVMALAVFTAIQSNTSEAETSPTYVKWFDGPGQDLGGAGECACTMLDTNFGKAAPLTNDMFGMTV